MNHMIEIQSVTKKFSKGGFCLGPIQLKLAGGDTLALLGQNGAGKTSKELLMKYAGQECIKLSPSSRKICQLSDLLYI